jgi:hypothetical protein
MTRFLSLARAAGCTSFVLLLAGACGGQSFKGGEGDAGSGGTAQTAGSKATGGGSNISGSGTTAGAGSAIDYDTCQVATDCVLGYRGCCGVCDGPDLTADDFLAYNQRYEAQVRMQECGGGVNCGPCPTIEPRTNIRPYFVPNCVHGECVVEDIRESDVTACEIAADCRLRNGTSCCEGCGDGNFVAVARDGGLQKLVCGEPHPICLDCAAVPPDGLEAQCSSQGHCVVRDLLAEQTP